MKSYFIIGTDTSCGKTHVTCAMIKMLQAKGRTVMALKPVASGCDMINGRLVSDDVQRLNVVQGEHSRVICPWPMPLPISPHLAARSAGLSLCARDIVAFCQDPSWSSYEYLFIEGAGGLMVPLNDDETWIDVLQRSQIPVIFVVGMRLGCINHALLTVEALKQHHIDCAGWIANCIDPTMLFLEENIETLKSKISFPLLARVDQDLTWFSTPI